MVAFFTEDGGSYLATEMAVSAWSPSQLAGTAVCGLLARELETHSPGAGFVPARFSADLFRPVLNEPIRLHSQVVRAGRRVRVVDASIVQRDEVRVRASVMYLAASQQPPGQVWQSDRELPVPSERLGPEGAPPLFKSGNFDWTHDFASGVNAERKCAWHSVPALVEGYEPTPFERVAFVSDSTNLVCHWGTAGVGFINSDVSFTLSRLPDGHEVGVQALDQVSSAGVAVASAALYDRSGPLGTCTITALSNAERQVDMAAFAASRSFPEATVR